MPSDYANLKPFPDLPVDICRQILETAALSGDSVVASCLSLVLVSKAVHAWITPILYQGCRLSRASPAKLASFTEAMHRGHHDHVHKLSIMAGDNLVVDVVSQILSSCTSLRTLALWSRPQLSVEKLFRAVQSAAHLTHFATLGYNGFHVLPFLPSSLTHVCLIGDARNQSVAGWAALFKSHPAITHIMFHNGCTTVTQLANWMFGLDGTFDGMCALASAILSAASGTLDLKALICFVPSEDPEGALNAIFQMMDSMVADDRFVLVYQERVATAYSRVDGIMYYEKPGSVDWMAEWDHLLREDELDFWATVDDYLAKRAIKRAESSRDQ